MIGRILGLVTDPIYGTVAGGLFLVIMRVIPNDRIQKIIGKFAKGLGVAMTLGLSKWAYTAPLWNKTIEPFFIDLIDNTVNCFTREFVVGLRSDNPKK